MTDKAKAIRDEIGQRFEALISEYPGGDVSFALCASVDNGEAIESVVRGQASDSIVAWSMLRNLKKDMASAGLVVDDESMVAAAIGSKDNPQ